MGIRVQACIGPAVLPEKFIQIKGQIRGVVKPYVIPVRFLHDRGRLLLFLRREGLLHRNDLTRQPVKFFRIFELFLILIHKVIGKVGKTFLTETGHEKGARHDLDHFAVLIINCPVQGQPVYFPFIIADNRDRLRIRVVALYASPDCLLHGFKASVKLGLIRCFPRLYHQHFQICISSFFLFAAPGAAGVFSCVLAADSFPSTEGFSGFSGIEIPPSETSVAVRSGFAGS